MSCRFERLSPDPHSTSDRAVRRLLAHMRTDPSAELLLQSRDQNQRLAHFWNHGAQFQRLSTRPGRSHISFDVRFQVECPAAHRPSPSMEPETARFRDAIFVGCSDRMWSARPESGCLAMATKLAEPSLCCFTRCTCLGKLRREFRWSRECIIERQHC